ncbi:hypothetical protein HY385_01725 [Candidatus Daviesbacteria bacterium]|nr:hypothetical protein [Candidatus Daviesbacteria bacterium]
MEFGLRKDTKCFIPLITPQSEFAKKAFIPLRNCLTPPKIEITTFKPRSWEQFRDELTEAQLEEKKRRIKILQAFEAEVQRQIEDEKRQRDAILAAWLSDVLTRPTRPWEKDKWIIPLKEPFVNKKRYPQGPFITDPFENYL